MTPLPPVTGCDERLPLFSSDAITFDQLWHHLFPKSKKGKVLSNKTQIRVIDSMEPVIFTKMLRNLSKKLVAKFPATAVLLQYYAAWQRRKNMAEFVAPQSCSAKNLSC